MAEQRRWGTREGRANRFDPGQQFSPTPENEYGEGGGSSLEATMERMRQASTGGERETRFRPPGADSADDVRSSSLGDDEPVFVDPGADSADDVPETGGARDTFARRTADDEQPFGAADDDQRMH